MCRTQVNKWQSYSQDGNGYGIYGQRYNSNGTIEGSEFKINTYTTSRQINPAVAMDTSGNFVVTWQSYFQDGDEYGIYAQRYNSKGTIGNEFRANNYYNENQSNSAIAIDNSGNFIISWQSDGQDGYTYGIYAQRYTSDGTIGNEFRVNTYTTGDQNNPKIAMDSNGNFAFAWSSNGQDGSKGGIYSKRYNKP